MTRRFWFWWLRHKFIERDNWLLVIGSDIFNDHAGLTFHWGKLPPMNDWKRWRVNWRINFQWPVTVRHHRARVR